jgi:carboxyl-terminal processing protease
VQTIIPLGAQRRIALDHGALLHAVRPFHPSEGHRARHKGAPRSAGRSEGRTDTEGEASLRGHLKAEGAEESGSQSYVPPDEKDDRALKEALDLLRGTITDVAFPSNPKAVVPQ